jgi:hypothetical protein
MATACRSYFEKSIASVHFMALQMGFGGMHH